MTVDNQAKSLSIEPNNSFHCGDSSPHKQKWHCGNSTVNLLEKKSMCWSECRIYTRTKNPDCFAKDRDNRLTSLYEQRAYCYGPMQNY
ncbi:hypothetical protein BRADI_4g01292v3 [Brachypodium distachyon]|uniref:Uncharacterized protein n=1 Tax=Brachypodium distachyon TaxID=15368 RepID=A0A2K2CJU6_BRADI|nr:hypothetical protein BRADI_4g01292v3 [Brachypodium distachyon]